ncbi:skin secretory protein xP2 [Drosophila erecta]|uniref:skin secretory protein xP2 n=1 Tax=Drosophila erecta TaxID=7220 RepID=UPI0001781620|nr:skin secretory protein xP2 [Drosophila erecta]
MKFHIIAFAFLGLAAADVSHLKLGLSVDGGYGLSAASSSAAVVPGGDSSSYQPAEYTAEHLQTAEVVSGGDSVAAEVVSGGDSVAAEVIPQVETSVPAAIGADTYAPVPAAIGADTYAPVPAAIGADTYTPEKFIPQEVQEAHYESIQEQEAVVPGGDASSYQPAEYTAEHLQTAQVVSGGDAVAAEVIPGGDSSSYQPAEYTPALLATSVPAAIGADTYAPVPAAIGADTYAPEKFIPQEVQEVQEQEQEVVVPGGDSSSYQPAEYTPAYLKESVVAPAAAAAVSGGDSGFYQSAVSQTGYVQSQAKAVVAASAGSFYQNAQPLPIAAYVQAQAPVAIAANTITTPLLQTTYSTSGQETQYASNGGYVY